MRWGAALGLAGLVLSGCSPKTAPTSEPSSTMATVNKAPLVSTVAVGETVPGPITETVGEQLRLPSLKALKLKVSGRFESHGAFTVAMTGPVKDTVSNDLLKTAADAIASLDGKAFVVTLTLENKRITFRARAHVRTPTERLLTYVLTNDEMQPLSEEAKLPGRPGFTSYSTTYNGSFVLADGAAEPLKFGGKVIPRTVQRTYVELCQNMLVLGVDSKDPAFVGPWQGHDGYAALGAQENVCNDLGYAMAVARSGLDYDAYTKGMDEPQRRNATQTIQYGMIMPRLRIDEATYNTLG